MGALWRWTIRLLGLMILVIVGLGAYLTVYLDPNEYRAEIEQLAAEQGVPLRLKGDLSWTFWPSLGLSLEQVSLGDSLAPLLNAERMSAQVAVAPLLRQQVVIDSILLDGASVNLIRDAQGQANWELSAPRVAVDTATDASVSVPNEKPSEAAQRAKANDQPMLASGMSLQVARVTLSNLSLNYQDQRHDQAFELRESQLVLQDFDLSGQTFHWQQSSQLQLPDKPLLDISSQGRASLDWAAKQVQLLESVMRLSANRAALEMNVKGDIDLARAVVDLNAGITPFNLQQWLTQWQIDLPPMAAADALNHVGGSARIASNNQGVKIEDISMILDGGQWLGHAAMSEADGFTLVLNADQLDLDRYLPMAPPSTTNVANATGALSASAASAKPSPSVPGKAKTAGAERVLPKFSDTPLPLDGLRELQAIVALNIGQLTAKGLPFEDVVLRARAQDGLLELKRLAANQAQGTLSLSGKLDTRHGKARMGVTGDLASVQINPLLQALAGESRLTGLVSTQFSLASSGDSLRQWQKHAQGTLTAKAAELTITTLDIERSACELAALVNRKPQPDLTWKNHTQFEQLDAELKLNGEVLSFERLNAEVENLRVNARGRLDLRDGRFDVPMDVAFIGQADTERDCQVRDRWRNRDLPLRCEDRLATVSARSCGPDRDRLDDLLSDEVKAQAQDKLKDKLQEKLGKERGEAVDQLLRGLFKRRD
ncbi:MAG: AsmA family protein [Cellvibrionaceae bacterium]